VWLNRQDVKHKTTGTSLFNHPQGRAAIAINYERLLIPGSDMQALVTYPRPAVQRLRIAPAPARQYQPPPTPAPRAATTSPPPHGPTTTLISSLRDKHRGWHRYAYGTPHLPGQPVRPRPENARTVAGPSRLSRHAITHLDVIMTL